GEHAGMACGGTRRGQRAYHGAIAWNNVRSIGAWRRTRRTSSRAAGGPRAILRRAVVRPRRRSNEDADPIFDGLHAVTAGRIIRSGPQILRPSWSGRFAGIRRSTKESRLRLHHEQDAERATGRFTRSRADRRFLRGSLGTAPSIVVEW